MDVESGRGAPGDDNPGRPGDGPDPAAASSDAGTLGQRDIDNYAKAINQANVELGLADAQIHDHETPALRDLLARASASSTVRRRRVRRV